jgi:chromosome condensin MukBEF ATPase and DNA-binding subunit MukB
MDMTYDLLMFEDEDMFTCLTNFDKDANKQWKIQFENKKDCLETIERLLTRQSILNKDNTDDI